jgi:hypothetical protein
MATWDKISEKYIRLANEEYFSECYKTLLKTASALESELLEKNGLSLVFCKSRLQNATYSYIYDVERYKDFHGSPEASDKKKAVFFIKWIVKVSPFFLEIKDKSKYSKRAFEGFAPIINSMLAVKLFSVITAEDPRKYIQSNFVYALHYDMPSVNMMYAIFEK